MTFLTQSEAFAVYFNAKRYSKDVVIRIDDDVAEWLRSNYLSTIRSPYTFEKVEGGWRFKLGIDRGPGRQPTPERVALMGLQPGQTAVFEGIAGRYRVAANNVTRSRGIRFSVRDLDPLEQGGPRRAEVTRADEQGRLPRRFKDQVEASEDSAQQTEALDKYGFAGLAVGASLQLQPPTLVDQVRACAQYQRRRYGRVYTVSRAKDGVITITRTA